MTKPVWAIDTSVAVPRLLTTHPLYRVTMDLIGFRKAHLAGHALNETYAVLTRLPGDARMPPKDVVRLLEHNFGPPLLLPPETARAAPQIFAELGITGGAVYDGLVALAARENDAILITRDARASAVYDAIGVELEIVPG